VRSFWLICALLLSLQSQAASQTTNGADQAELIRNLLTRIGQLEKRVEELEGRSERSQPSVVGTVRPTVVTPQSTPLAQSTVLPAPIHDHQLPEPAEGQSAPIVRIQGFSDVNFQATDQHGSRSGFNEGQFVLHLASALSKRVFYFGELSLSARADAGQGSPAAAGFNAEVERSIIRFDQSDYLKVSFGRYHTPINYWNNTFHHGSWLQTTISRPEMTQFGGSFIPVHFIGSLVEGQVPAGGLNLNYNVGMGNGRASVISRGGDFGDINNNRAWLVNLFVKPDKLYGLQAGASFYRDKISPITGRENREWIESAHLVWAKESPEFIAEFANVSHREIGRTTAFNSQAWYAQTAYRLPWFDRLWKPYFRYEYIHVPQSDLIFRVVRDLSGETAGIRYDIASFAALKFEYRHQRRPGIPNLNGVFLQTSFTF
jgi:hypothetical protein